MYLNVYDLSAWDGCWSFVFIWRFIYKYLNACPFDCIVIVGSEKVWTLNLVLTTPVGCLLSLQLTVLSRSVIVVLSNVLVASLCNFAYALSVVYGCLSHGCVRSLPFSLRVTKVVTWYVFHLLSVLLYCDVDMLQFLCDDECWRHQL